MHQKTKHSHAHGNVYMLQIHRRIEQNLCEHEPANAIVFVSHSISYYFLTHSLFIIITYSTTTTTKLRLTQFCCCSALSLSLLIFFSSFFFRSVSFVFLLRMRLRDNDCNDDNNLVYDSKNTFFSNSISASPIPVCRLH